MNPLAIGHIVHLKPINNMKPLGLVMYCSIVKTIMYELQNTKIKPNT
jgi:hypothetical protein